MKAGARGVAWRGVRRDVRRSPEYDDACILSPNDVSSTRSDPRLRHAVWSLLVVNGRRSAVTACVSCDERISWRRCSADRPARSDKLYESDARTYGRWYTSRALPPAAGNTGTSFNYLHQLYSDGSPGDWWADIESANTSIIRHCTLMAIGDKFQDAGPVPYCSSAKIVLQCIRK